MSAENAQDWSFLPPRLLSAAAARAHSRFRFRNRVRNSFAVRIIEGTVITYACLIEFPILPSLASFCLCSDVQCHLTTRTSSSNTCHLLSLQSFEANSASVESPRSTSYVGVNDSLTAFGETPRLVARADICLLICDDRQWFE